MRVWLWRGLLAGGLLGLPVLAPPARAADIAALTQSAEAGDADAAMALGTAYDLGDGVAMDPAAALHWYEIAAQRGNPSAMFNVGVMYDSGIGTRRNRALAATWYQRAADHGHARAAYDLGLLYEEGEGVHRNLASAVRWYRAAAAAGLSAGTMKLAALAPLLRADVANADYARAQSLIEQRGLADAGPQALDLLLRAAQGGYPLAQYDLGYLYENGLGTPTDRVQAYIWYRRALRRAPGSDPMVVKAAGEGARRLEPKLDPTERAAAAQALRTASR